MTINSFDHVLTERFHHAMENADLRQPTVPLWTVYDDAAREYGEDVARACWKEATMRYDADSARAAAESMRKPPADALWTLVLETRFGPDYLWLEPMTRMDGTRAVALAANETTDPIDGYRTTDITLGIEELACLRDGVDAAIGWLMDDPAQDLADEKVQERRWHAE